MSQKKTDQPALAEYQVTSKPEGYLALHWDGTDEAAGALVARLNELKSGKGSPVKYVIDGTVLHLHHGGSSRMAFPKDWVLVSLLDGGTLVMHVVSEWSMKENYVIDGKVN